MQVIRSFNRFVENEEGVTAIEYGLIAALIAVVIIAGATAVGLNLNALFTFISTQIAVPG
jgi:pilus assembly protein Flp/PilA